MKSPWKVSSTMIGGEKAYQVYRLYDAQKIDHSGNREVDYLIHETKNDAIERCRELNALEV